MYIEHVPNRNSPPTILLRESYRHGNKVKKRANAKAARHRMGQTIPLACQDCANTKAAYRFMDNDRVSEHDILSGNFRATAQRFSMTNGPILVLQDTTTFSYERERPEIVGYAGSAITSAERRSRARNAAS